MTDAASEGDTREVDATEAAAPVDWHTQPHAIVERDGIRYTLLGTAHVSHASVDAVRAAMGASAVATAPVAIRLLPEP